MAEPCTVEPAAFVVHQSAAVASPTPDAELDLSPVSSSTSTDTSETKAMSSPVNNPNHPIESSIAVEGPLAAAGESEVNGSAPSDSGITPSNDDGGAACTKQSLTSVDQCGSVDQSLTVVQAEYVRQQVQLADRLGGNLALVGKQWLDEVLARQRAEAASKENVLTATGAPAPVTTDGIGLSVDVALTGEFVLPSPATTSSQDSSATSPRSQQQQLVTVVRSPSHRSILKVMRTTHQPDMDGTRPPSEPVADDEGLSPTAVQSLPSSPTQGGTIIRSVVLSARQFPIPGNVGGRAEDDDEERPLLADGGATLAVDRGLFADWLVRNISLDRIMDVMHFCMLAVLVLSIVELLLCWTVESTQRNRHPTLPDDDIIVESSNESSPTAALLIVNKLNVAFDVVFFIVFFLHGTIYRLCDTYRLKLARVERVVLPINALYSTGVGCYFVYFSTDHLNTDNSFSKTALTIGLLDLIRGIFSVLVAVACHWMLVFNEEMIRRNRVGSQETIG